MVADGRTDGVWGDERCQQQREDVDGVLGWGRAVDWIVDGSLLWWMIDGCRRVCFRVHLGVDDLLESC